MSSEFLVEGVLLRVLRLSRLFGGAPLRFRRIGNCIFASVSHLWFIYSCVAATLLNVLAFVFTYFLQPPMPELDDTFKKQLFDTLRMSQDILITLRVFMDSFMSFKRMKSLTLQMNRLQKMFQKAKKNSIAFDRQNNVLIIALMLILLAKIIETTIVKASHIGSDIILTCQLIKALLQELKIVFLNVKISQALNELKMNLKQLLRNKNRLEVQKEIRRVGQSYLEIYDVVSQINKFDGGIIFLTFTFIVIFLVFTGFVFADDLNDTEKIASHLAFDSLMIAVPALASIHRLIILIRSCHQVHKEVIELNMAVSELVYTTEVGCEIPVELDLLIKQLQLTCPTFSVLGIFIVKQSTLTTILSAWVSYTVVLIQVRSKSI